MTADAAQTTRPVVLVVEDEAMLRRVVALTLKREGFAVLEAGDGAEGLELLRSEAPIDVLLTDVRMPVMDGYQLAEASLSLRPGMPVILMTGFTNEDMPDSIRRAAIPMIRKPFDFASLGGSIRQTLRR